MLSAIMKGGVLILISVIVSKLFALVYVPILARFLGPSGLGLYHLALVMLPWFVTFSSLSLSTIVAQLVAEHAKHKHELSQIIMTCLAFSTILSVLGGFVHYFLAETIAVRFFHTPQLVPYLQFASLGIITAILYNTFIGVARGMKRFNIYLLMEVLKSTALVVLGIAFLAIFHLNVYGALFAVVFSSFVPIGYWMVHYSRYLGIHFQWRIVHLAVQSGFWVTLIGLLLTVLLTIDKFFLGVYTDPHTVGLYAAAVSLVTTATLIPGSFKGSILPFISENFTHKDEISRTMQRVTSYVLILVGAVILFLILFRAEIILLLFGKAFAASSDILPLLAFTLLPYTVYIVLHSVILDRRIVTRTTLMLIPITLLALVIDALLIKRFSMLGAGIGLFISHSFIALSYIHVIRKRFRFNAWSLLGLFAIILAVSTVALLIQPTILYKILLFPGLLVLYTALLFLCKYLHPTDIPLFWEKARMMLGK